MYKPDRAKRFEIALEQVLTEHADTFRRLAGVVCKTDCTDVEDLPCGCWFGNHGDAMVFSACTMECTWYRFTMLAAQEVGQPVHIITLGQEQSNG